jgi:hypothetical protein
MVRADTYASAPFTSLRGSVDVIAIAFRIGRDYDRRIANTRDGKPVRSDPVAASEKEHPLHATNSTASSGCPNCGL